MSESLLSVQIETDKVTYTEGITVSVLHFWLVRKGAVHILMTVPWTRGRLLYVSPH